MSPCKLSLQSSRQDRPAVKGILNEIIYGARFKEMCRGWKELARIVGIVVFRAVWKLLIRVVVPRFGIFTSNGLLDLADEFIAVHTRLLESITDGHENYQLETSGLNLKHSWDNQSSGFKL